MNRAEHESLNRACPSRKTTGLKTLRASRVNAAATSPAEYALRFTMMRFFPNDAFVNLKRDFWAKAICELIFAAAKCLMKRRPLMLGNADAIVSQGFFGVTCG